MAIKNFKNFEKQKIMLKFFVCFFWIQNFHKNSETIISKKRGIFAFWSFGLARLKSFLGTGFLENSPNNPKALCWPHWAPESTFFAILAFVMRRRRGRKEEAGGRGTKMCLWWGWWWSSRWWWWSCVFCPGRSVGRGRERSHMYL